MCTIFAGMYHIIIAPYYPIVTVVLWSGDRAN